MAEFTRKTRYKESGLIGNFEYNSFDRTINSEPARETDVVLRRSTHYYSTLETITHCVYQGQNIHNIAKSYYKDARLWWFIADYNPRVDVFNLKEFDELIIPPSTEVFGY